MSLALHVLQSPPFTFLPSLISIELYQEMVDFIDYILLNGW